jgi:hypothetical protein
VLACSLPRVIRPRARIAEGAKPFIVADQFLDLGACAGLDQAEGYFANDFVALIAPGPGISRSASHGRDDCEHNNDKPLHPILQLTGSPVGRLQWPAIKV